MPALTRGGERRLQAVTNIATLVVNSLTMRTPLYNKRGACAGNMVPFTTIAAVTGSYFAWRKAARLSYCDECNADSLQRYLSDLAVCREVTAVHSVTNSATLTLRQIQRRARFERDGVPGDLQAHYYARCYDFNFLWRKTECDENPQTLYASGDKFTTTDAVCIGG